MSAVITISKSRNELIVTVGGAQKMRVKAVHGGPATPTGRKTIKRWVWGAVSSRWEPNTWFSYGATFKQWPAPSKRGTIRVFGENWAVIRDTITTGRIQYPRGEADESKWFKVWKDDNLYGVAMADLSPGRVELHGTGKDVTGKDVFPAVTHGCVRLRNEDIIKVRTLVPSGSVVIFNP